MKHFSLIAQGVDVSGVNAELNAQPELWNARTYRTERPDSPHNGIDDIWVRWRAEAECTSHERINEMHYPVFWPAWYALPSLHPIVRNLSHAVNATALGGILITKIRPGEMVKPHIDKGSWHAETFNVKCYLCLAGNPLSLNWVEDEPFNPREGDVFSFSNQKLHHVTNEGSSDRVTCIICFRVEA